MGFFALAIFAIDILLGFTALRKSANKSHLEKTETDQLKNSRSVITAARITARHSNRKVNRLCIIGILLLVIFDLSLLLYAQVFCSNIIS